MQEYIFSWHHLEGYISRISVRDSDLENARGQLNDPSRKPFRVKRSRRFDIKDTDQRVEFLSMIASILLKDLWKSCKSSRPSLGRLYGPKEEQADVQDLNSDSEEA